MKTISIDGSALIFGFEAGSPTPLNERRDQCRHIFESALSHTFPLGPHWLFQHAVTAFNAGAHRLPSPVDLTIAATILRLRICIFKAIGLGERSFLLNSWLASSSRCPLWQLRRVHVRPYFDVGHRIGGLCLCGSSFNLHFQIFNIMSNKLVEYHLHDYSIFVGNNWVVGKNCEPLSFLWINDFILKFDLMWIILDLNFGGCGYYWHCNSILFSGSEIFH